jgi:hypothetical protein
LSVNGSAFRFNTGSSGYVFESHLYPGGGDGPFIRGRGLSLAELGRGLSNVALLGERCPGAGRLSKLDSVFQTKLALPDETYPQADQLAEMCETAATHHLSIGWKTMDHAGWRWHMTGLVDSGYNHVCRPNREYSCVVEGAIGWTPNQGGAITATSYHVGSVNICKADGSLSTFTPSVDLNIWRDLGRRSLR